MKNIQILVILLIALAATACEAGSNTAEPTIPGPKDETLQLQALQDAASIIPVGTLTDEQAAGLLLMREEEKLARDVYLHFSEVYGLPIFSNIASSEQRHMSAIKTLLDRYSLEDPVTDDSPGVFTDAHLSDLYAQLVQSGQNSLLDALIVGATIEDLDINDLTELSRGLDLEDVLLVYGNLVKGSRNHLRSYYSQIIRNNGSYTPQYISREMFDSIVNSPMERGRR